MEKIEFRPTKILLVFRLIGVVVFALAVGGVAAGVCVGAKLGATLGVSGAVAFALGFLVPCALLGIYAVLFFFSVRYELDSRYISKACGVIWKQRRSVPLEKITNLDVRQGPFERIFGYGKIWIFTPSTGGVLPEEQLLGVVNPQNMKQTLIERFEAAKQPQLTVAQAGKAEAAGDVVSLLTEIRDSLKKMESSLSQHL